MTDGASPPDPVDERRDLRADCSGCQGLCCVAPAFARSADFAIDKPAGRPCPKLSSDFSCSIHADLRGQGFPGCTVFDCFGAGQQVVQVTFAGRNWRQAPEAATSMFAVFNAMRQLKELLWYLAEALAALRAGPLREEVHQAQVHTRGLVDAPAPTSSSSTWQRIAPRSAPCWSRSARRCVRTSLAGVVTGSVPT